MWIFRKGTILKINIKAAPIFSFQDFSDIIFTTFHKKVPLCCGYNCNLSFRMQKLKIHCNIFFVLVLFLAWIDAYASTPVFDLWSETWRNSLKNYNKFWNGQQLQQLQQPTIAANNEDNNNRKKCIDLSLREKSCRKLNIKDKNSYTIRYTQRNKSIEPGAFGRLV